MSISRTHVILNPASAGGHTHRQSAQILTLLRRRLGNCFSVHFTRGRGDAALSVAEARARGCELIVVVGGDGTIHEAVNGLLSETPWLASSCRLGIISRGTGQGFAQSLGLSAAIEDQVELLASGEVRGIDVGRLTFRNCRMDLCQRYFVNECQLGIGATVVRRVQGNHKRLGGSLGFGLGVLQTVFYHRNQQMTVSIDGRVVASGPLTGIVAANGPFTGGGMNLAPTAQLDDGTLNILVMNDLTLARRLQSFPKIYSGSHLTSKCFGYHEGKRVSIRSEERVFVEADGELLGTAPCDIEIVSSALEVVSVPVKGENGHATVS